MEQLNFILKNYNKNRWGISDFALQTSFYNKRLADEISFSPKSIISFIFPYYTKNKEFCNISKYAIIPDYHQWVKKELLNIVIKLKDAYPNNNFECYTDNSPIYEVSAAVNAGLGFKGKNNLLVTKEYGSFVFIGEIITDKKFDFDEKCNYSCFNCNKCVLNCKSSALKTKSYLLCNSYLTQKKGELLDFEKKIIKDGKYIWGCDDCQDCCPYNQNLKQVDFDEKLVYQLELSELSRLSNKEFLDKYHNSAFIYRGKNIIIRNISIKNNLF